MPPALNVRSLNVATPSMVDGLVAPPSVPPAGPLVMVRLIVEILVSNNCSLEFSTETWISGESDWPAIAVAGAEVTASCCEYSSVPVRELIRTVLAPSVTC